MVSLLNQSPTALMKNALNNSSFSCSALNAGSDDWNCAYTNDNLILAIIIKTNPLGFEN